jgi:hypothetical protein
LNIWTSIANYNGNITNDGVSVGYNGIIYSGLGGQPYSGNCWDDWKAYNETTNSWSSMTVFPGVDRRNLAAFVLDNEIYAGGGQPEGGVPGNDFYKYNVSTNSWIPIANCPSTTTAYTRNSSFVLNNKVYLALSDGLWEFNPQINTWTSYSIPFTTGVDAAFALNGKGYIIKANSKEVWEWTSCSNTYSVISESICNSYTAPDGQVYTNSGNYTAVIPNSTGCDSTISINLTVLNSTTSNQNIISCESYLAPDGQEYTSSGIYQAIIPNSNGCDSTITIDLTINSPTSNSIVEHSCGNYMAPDGHIYATSGIYTAIIPNQSGCDSTITIDLNVTNIDNSVAIDGLQLSSNQLVAAYQWLDCDNNDQALFGEFNQYFEVVENGNYAVEISYNGCIDTSECILIDYVGVNSIESNNFSLYFDATDISLKLKYNNLPENVKIEIVDLQGKVALTSLIKPSIDISTLINGLYFVRILNDEQVRLNQKFMKYE